MAQKAFRSHEPHDNVQSEISKPTSNFANPLSELEEMAREISINRADELRQFRSLVASQETQSHILESPDPTMFQDVINMTLNQFDISQKNVADLATVDIATVGRWASGASAPQRLMRKAVVDAIVQLIDIRLEYPSAA